MFVHPVPERVEFNHTRGLRRVEGVCGAVGESGRNCANDGTSGCHTGNVAPRDEVEKSGHRAIRIKVARRSWIPRSYPGDRRRAKDSSIQSLVHLVVCAGLASQW